MNIGQNMVSQIVHLVKSPATKPEERSSTSGIHKLKLLTRLSEDFSSETSEGSSQMHSKFSKIKKIKDS